MRFPKDRLANLVTTIRDVLGPLLIAYILYLGISGRSFQEYWIAIAWTSISLLDALDGHLARKFKSQPNGAMFDELSDKIIIHLAFSVLCYLVQISLYLWLIMFVRDIFATLIRVRTKKTTKTSPVEKAKYLGKTKMTFQCATITAALLPIFSGQTLLVFLLTATSAVLSIISGMEILILAMDAKNPKWLKGSSNRIKFANWLTVSRLALVPVIPYTFIAQPFGHFSYLVGTILAAIAVPTDVIDGFIARKLNQTTKIGELLDLFADKILFYFCLAGILHASNYTLMFPNPTYYIVLAILVVHDVACIIGYFVIDKRIIDLLESIWIDKLRYALSCTWLIIVSFALAIPNQILILLSLFLISIAAVASIVALFILVLRIRTAKKAIQ